MQKEKKRSLSTEITILNIITSVGTLLLLGGVMLLTFFFIDRKSVV